MRSNETLQLTIWISYRDCTKFNMSLGNRAEAVRFAKDYYRIEEIYFSEDGIDLAWMDEIGLHFPK